MKATVYFAVWNPGQNRRDKLTAVRWSADFMICKAIIEVDHPRCGVLGKAWREEWGLGAKNQIKIQNTSIRLQIKTSLMRVLKELKAICKK